MNRKNPIRQKLLYEETVDVAVTADAVDLERLRYRFAPLFDRAAQAVQRAGYEQDDAVIERYLVCRFGSDAPRKVPAVSLADPKWFLHHLVGITRSVDDASIGPDEILIVGLRVEAVLETWS